MEPCKWETDLGGWRKAGAGRQVFVLGEVSVQEAPGLVQIWALDFSQEEGREIFEVTRGCITLF